MYAHTGVDDSTCPSARAQPPARCCRSPRRGLRHACLNDRALASAAAMVAAVRSWLAPLHHKLRRRRRLRCSASWARASPGHHDHATWRFLTHGAETATQIIRRRHDHRVQLIERGRPRPDSAPPLEQQHPQLLALATAAGHASSPCRRRSAAPPAWRRPDHSCHHAAHRAWAARTQTPSRRDRPGSEQDPLRSSRIPRSQTPAHPACAPTPPAADSPPPSPRRSASRPNDQARQAPPPHATACACPHRLPPSTRSRSLPSSIGDRPGQGCVGQGTQASIRSPASRDDATAGDWSIQRQASTAASLIAGHPAAASHSQPHPGRSRHQRRYTAWLSGMWLQVACGVVSG